MYFNRDLTSRHLVHIPTVNRTPISIMRGQINRPTVSPLRAVCCRGLRPATVASTCCVGAVKLLAVTGGVAGGVRDQQERTYT